MSTGKRNRNAGNAKRRSALIGSAMLTVSLSTAHADPQGGIVVDGHGTISSPANGSTVINQTSNSLTLNWQSFNIGANERVKFEQPSSVAVAVNRILDQNASQIFGRLDANGRVVLINPNGMVFGRTAQINVGSLIATSLDAMSVDANGKYSFRGSRDNLGSIVNQGSITAAQGGSISLLGGTVTNEGLIVAEYGTVNLAAGRAATLDFFGDGLLRVEVGDQDLSNPSGAAAAVNNTGEIHADGGQVFLTAGATHDVFSRAVNNDGLISAKRIDDSGGVIRLVGTDGIVTSSGTLDASGATAASSGGSVQVLGDRVGLLDNAVVDVSGATGGGSALIGGDFQGKNAAVKNAERTVVSAGTSIKADATVAGDGGKVVVWSDDTTVFRGSISAKGTGVSGNGGFAEVSGKQNLGFEGNVDLSAVSGSTGALLLDPDTINIIAGVSGTGAQDAELADNEILFADDLGNGTLTFDVTAAAVADSVSAANTRLQANTAINVNDDIIANTTPHNLLLIAPTIALNANISIGAGGELTLNAGTSITQAVALSLSADIVHFAGAGSVGSSTARVNVGALNIDFNKSGGNTWLNSTGGMNLTGSTGGNLDVVTAGSITQGSALTVGGAAAFDATGNGDINLPNGGNAFSGSVSLNDSGTHTIALTDGGALQLAASSNGTGTFDIIAGGDITQSGALNLGGIATFNAPANATIILGNAGNNFATTVNFAPLTGHLQDVTVTDSNAFEVQGITLDGSLAVTTTSGGITQNGALVIAGTSVFSAGASAITVSDPGNSFTGRIALTNSGNFAVALRNSGGIALDTVSVGSSTFDLIAGGNITQFGVTTLTTAGGAATFSAPNAASITLGNNNTFNGTVAFTSGGTLANVTLRDSTPFALQNAGLTLTNNLNINAAGITQGAGALVVPGTATFTGGGNAITLNTGTNNFGTLVLNNTGGGGAVSVTDADAVILGASSLGTGTLAINTVGDITQTGAITQAGAGTATFNAGAHAVTLTDNNDFIGSVVLQNSGNNNASINDVNTLALGASTLGIGTLNVTTNGDITQTGVISQVGGAAGLTTFNAGGHAIALTSSNAFTGTIRLLNSGVNNVGLTNSTAIVLGTSSTGGGTLDIAANAGSITQTGSFTTAGGAATFHVNGNSITLGNAGNTFNGTVAFAGPLQNVTLRDTTAFDLQTLTMAGNLDINAAGITQSGVLTVTGTSTFTAGANAISLTNAGNNFTGAVTLSNSGNNNVAITDTNGIQLAASSVGSGTLTVDAVGISQTGAITQQAGALNTTFNAHAGVITLNDVGNDFTGLVSLNNSGGNNVSIRDSSELKLDTSSLGTGTLTVNALGIIQNGAIVQAAGAGAVTLNAGAGYILLGNANNDFTGTVSMSNTGNNDVSVADVNTLNIGTSSLGSGTLQVQAVTITQSAPIVQEAAAGGIAFYPGSGGMQLTDAGNDFTGAVSIYGGAGSVAIVDQNDMNLYYARSQGDITVTSGGSLSGTGSIDSQDATRLVTLNAIGSIGPDYQINAGHLSITAGANASVTLLRSAGTAIDKAGVPGVFTVAGNVNFTAALGPVAGGTLNCSSCSLGAPITDLLAGTAGTSQDLSLVNYINEQFTINSGGWVNIAVLSTSGLPASGTTIILPVGGLADVFIRPISGGDLSTVGWSATAISNVSQSTRIALAATGNLTVNGTVNSTLGRFFDVDPGVLSLSGGNIRNDALGHAFTFTLPNTDLIFNSGAVAASAPYALTTSVRSFSGGTGGESLSVNQASALRIGTQSGSSTLGVDVGAGTATLSSGAALTQQAGTTVVAQNLTVSGTSIGGGTPFNTNVGVLSATASAGDISIQEQDALQLGTVNASGNASITAGGAIADDANNSTRITANALTLSGTAIGATGANNEIDTTVASLTATASAGGIWANEADALTLTAAATGGPVNVSTTAGALTGNAVTGTGVILSAGGAALTMNGAITAGTGTANLASGGAMTLAGVTGASTTVNSGGALTLGTVNVGTGAASITATGAITDGTTGTAITAGALTISGSSLGSATNALNTRVTSLTATSTAGGIYVQETDGIQLGAISASGAGNDVSITAGGAITDDASNTTRIAANALTLSGTAIGAPGANNEIDTTVATLTATASSGGIWVNETDALTLTAGATGGPVNVSTTAGALTGNAVTGTGVTLNAGGAGNALTMNGAITAGTGAANLTSGGAMTLGGVTGASTTVNSGGALTLGVVNVGAGAASITAAGAITDGTTGTAITAGALTISGASIGSTTNALNTAVTSLTATSTAGGINVQETDGIQLGAISASGTGNDVSITAGGGITDDASNTTRIAANALTLSGTFIGATGANNEIDTTVASLTATATAGGIWVNETDALTLNATATGGPVIATVGGALTLGTVNAGTATANLTSGGAITDGTTGTAITAGALTISGTSIGSTTNAVNTSVSSLNATASAGGVYIQEADAVQIGTVTASGDVSIAAGGAITDDSSNTTRISGNLLTLSGTSLGAQGNELDTTIADLNATATAGGVYIAETDSLTVSQASAVGGTAAGSGSVQIFAGTSTTAATITTNVISARDTLLLVSAGDIYGTPGKTIAVPVAELRAGVASATVGHIGTLTTPVVFGSTLTSLSLILPVRSVAEPTKPRFDPVVDGPANVVPQIYTYTGGSGFAAFFNAGVGSIPLTSFFGVTQGQFTGAATANISAQAQTGDEQVFYVDWASFDPSVSLFGTLNPPMCLPADQQEDEDAGGGCGGGGAVASNDLGNWDGITLTANGWKQVRFFRRVSSIAAPTRRE